MSAVSEVLGDSADFLSSASPRAGSIFWMGSAYAMDEDDVNRAGDVAVRFFRENAGQLGTGSTGLTRWRWLDVAP